MSLRMKPACDTCARPLPPDGVTDPPEAPPVLNEATTQGDHIGSVVVPEEEEP